MRLSKGQGGSEAHGKSARTRERAHEKARARARAKREREREREREKEGAACVNTWIVWSSDPVMQS